MSLALIVIAIAATAAANPNSATDLKSDDASLEKLYEYQDSLESSGKCDWRVTFYDHQLYVAISVSADVQLDKNSFFIYNKRYPRARLAQTIDTLLTYEGLMYADQIWMLEESTQHSGYYYINNARYEGYRLAISSSTKELITYNDPYYYEDQLWRFQKEGDYCRIYNKRFPQYKIAKDGKASDKLLAYKGPDYEDQLWKLVPRFKATAREHVIWSIDNR